MNNNEQEIAIPSSKESKRIFIYEDAQQKLKINRSGKIYRQNILHYIPFLGPILSLIYANFVIGKTKCLRMEDSKRFSWTTFNVNLFGFIIWPLLFLGIWTVLDITLNYFAIGGDKDMGNTFGTTYMNQWTIIIEYMKTVKSINDIIGALFAIVTTVFIAPITQSANYVNIFTNKETGFALNINLNLMFLACLTILTIINPVNISNSIAFAGNKKKFIVVVEEDSVLKFE
ncbi:MAG: hypothetical protein ACRC4L_04120 [Mycoplasma sp.]